MPTGDSLLRQLTAAVPFQKPLQHHLLLVLLVTQVRPVRVRFRVGALAAVQSAHGPQQRDEIEPRARAQDGAEPAPQDGDDQRHHDYRYAQDRVEVPREDAVPMLALLAGRAGERSRAGHRARSGPQDRGARLTPPADASFYGAHLPAEGQPSSW